ncbi:unnamed protein product [Linum trigynum]|uniref:Disease resistance protein RGA3 n=1 Tax=Linum trigynum TaxID=586398 RepID=A0AAV2F0U4_9ROSI
MAEAALFNIAGAVLNLLGSKVLQEAALLWGMGDDINKLKLTLSSIQAVLLDAEEQSHAPQSHQLRLWLKELRQVVYRSEDLLDDFSTEVRRRQGTAAATEKISKEVKNFFSSSNQVAYGLKIVHGIQDIRAKLDEIAKRRDMFHLEVRPVESMARKLREQTHSDVPEVVVGRENDKKRVMEQLLLPLSQPKENVSVVSIVGIGGLGKTTLAQLLYNDETVKSHFEVKAWVCVSDNFDVKRVVEKIIESCTKRKPEKDLEMDTLRAQLHENVNGKKYLIVLDDVWNEDREKWSRLKGLLKSGAKGSCVMITTRLLSVAKLAATKGVEPNELKGLDNIDSWSLFREIAFDGGEATSGIFELMGREILEKCKGVPLAIKTVAGALLFKESESEWVAFKSKGMCEMDESENDIMSTLKLSYDHLPTHLKHCFAYCCLFPKDHNIDVETLIHLWIAQGFIQSSDPSNHFDIGIGYFKDLLWRSFFQEAKKGEHGDIIWCKMHDLMHDLATKVAGEEIATLAVWNSQDLLSFDSQLRVTRHVSLDLRVYDFFEEFCEVYSSAANTADANKLRTLIVKDASHINELQGVIFSNTTSLRALDLSHLWVSMVSDAIHTLKHLKYFDLSYNQVLKVLPEEITELVNLEVLKLEHCKVLEQLPKGIGKLSCLFHLGLDRCVKLKSMPPGIGKLCYLRKLPMFIIAHGDDESTSASIAGIGELRNLNNLRGSLMIVNLRDVKNPLEGKLANLKDKQHLEELVLVWEVRGLGVVSDAKAEGKLLEALRPNRNLKNLGLSYNYGFECPSWLPSMMSLVKLDISSCLNWKCLLSLDQLPFLAQLSLQDMESLEYIECGVATSSSSCCSFFPSLKSLILKGCPKFKGWLTPWTADEAVVLQFPSVSEVEISGCGSITSIPYFSRELQSLEFRGGSKELLKQILRMSPSLSSLPPQSRLCRLFIFEVLDLDILPNEILPRLSSSSLERLTIRYCPELRTLYPALPHHLTSVQSLDIGRCEKLDLCGGDDDEMMQQQFHGGVLLSSLLQVHFHKIPKLSHLPEWLQLAPELLGIRVDDCPIAYLPEWMPKLVRLHDLTIDPYVKSASQCVEQDWPKIAHIADIDINDLVIQEGGHLVALEELAALEEDSEEEEQDDVNDDDEDNEAEQVKEESRAEKEDDTSRLLLFFMDCMTRLTTCCSIFLRCFEDRSNS